MLDDLYIDLSFTKLFWIESATSLYAQASFGIVIINKNDKTATLLSPTGTRSNFYSDLKTVK